MRKIYSFMVAAVAMIATAACTQEIENVAPETNGETVVYTASVDGADTKATLNETTKKSEWVANDAITVLDGTKGWTFTTTGSGANADFSNSEGFGDYRPVLAVYPAGTYTANLATKTVNAHIPTYQGVMPGTYNEKAALAVAYSENNEFAFKNAHALLKFKIKGSNIKAIEFYGNADEAITGNMIVSLNDDNTIKSVSGRDTVFEEGTENEWTGLGSWVKCYSNDEANNWCFTDGETYYAAIAPANFESGVSLNVILADDTMVEKVKTTTTPKDLKANTILDLGEIEYAAAEPEVEEFEAWNGYIYLQPNAKWNEADARFAAYFFNDDVNTWENLTLVEGTQNIYGCKVPEDYTNVIFCRMNPEASGNNWDNKWGQTSDLKVADGNLYVIATDSWDSGSWKTVEAVEPPVEPEPEVPEAGLPSEWALAGTFNNWGNNVFKTTKTEELFVINNLSLESGDEIKVKAVATWDTSYGGGIKNLKANSWMTIYLNGSNIPVSAAGEYDVYFDHRNKKLYLMIAGTEYISATEQNSDGPAPTTPSEWYIVGSFNSWNPGDANYRMGDDGTYYVFDNFTTTGCEMKFAPGKWSNDKGASGNFSANTWLNTGGNNIKVTSGTYKIYLKKDLSQYKFEKK